jgi:hypothetical protein
LFVAVLAGDKKSPNISPIHIKTRDYSDNRLASLTTCWGSITHSNSLAFALDTQQFQISQ